MPQTDRVGNRSRRCLVRTGAWLLAIGGLAVFFFWPILGGGKSLWFRDTMIDDYQIAVATAANWKAGVLPLWEPRIGFGYPYAALPITGVFYPLTLILTAVPFPRAYNVFVIAHVLLTGVFVFLLLRRWRVSRPASAIGAVVGMFSGFTVTITSLTSFLKGLTWAPLALLTFDGFLAGGGKGHLAATALVLAIQGSGTDPQFVLFTVGLLAVLRWLRPDEARISLGRTAAGLLAVVGLSGLILAVLYVPLGELIGQSVRSSGLKDAERNLFCVSPTQLLSVVLPMSFPQLTQKHYLLSFPEGVQPLYTDLYLGCAVLALIAASLGWLVPEKPRDETASFWDVADRPNAKDHDRRTALPMASVGEPVASDRGSVCEWSYGRTIRVSLALAVIALVLSMGNEFPFEAWLVKVVWPLKAFRYPAKYFWFLGILVPLMAALGFEGLLVSRSRCGRLLAWSLASTLGLALLGLAVLHVSDVVLPWAFLGTRDSFLIFGRDAMNALRERWLENLQRVLTDSIALLFVFILWKSGRLRGSIALGILGLWVVSDLTLSTRWSYPTIDDRFWTTSPRIARCFSPSAGKMGAVSGLPVRYSTYRHAFLDYHPDQTTFESYLLGKERMDGLWGFMEGLNPATEFLSVCLSRDAAVFRILSRQKPEDLSRLLAAVGTRYFLGTSMPRPEPPGRVVGRAGSIVLRELDGAAPRAFIAPRARPASDGETIPSESTLLAMQRDVVFRPLPASAHQLRELRPRTIRRCEVREYQQGSMSIDFDLEGQGLLVVLEGFYPGWKAFVDGQERPIHLVAGAFRGVEVAQGEHRLDLRFQPWSFRIGALVSVLALLALLFWVSLRRRSRTRALSEPSTT